MAGRHQLNSGPDNTDNTDNTDKADNKETPELIDMNEGETPAAIKKMENRTKLIERIEKLYKFKSRDGKELLYKHNRTYIEGARKKIEKILSTQYAGRGPKWVKDITETIIQQNTTEMNEEFDPDPFIINCKNEFVNIQTGEIYRDDNYLSTMQIDTEYRPELGESKLLISMLKEAIPNDYNIFLEFFGTILLRNITEIPIRRMLINVGKTGRGKSAMITALRDVFGKSKFTKIDLKELFNERFKIDALNDKWGNITTELSEGEITKAGKAKALISGEGITAERKFGENYELDFKGRLITSTNELPTIELDGAFLKRLIMIKWEHEEFMDDIKKEKKLETSEERSRILNTLIKYAQATIKHGGLIHEKGTRDERKQLWMEFSEPTIFFIMDNCRAYTGNEPPPELKDPKNYEYIKDPPTKMVYSKYENFMKGQDRGTESINTFNRRLRAREFGSTKSTVNGITKDYWRGMYFKKRKDRDGTTQKQ